MSNSVINTPEFWEQVKQEYKPESNLDEISALCANSETFKKIWYAQEFRFLIRSEIQAHAKALINQGDFDNTELGDLFLFVPDTPNEMRAVRRAFIEYMLEKTKKDLQDKK